MEFLIRASHACALCASARSPRLHPDVHAQCGRSSEVHSGNSHVPQIDTCGVREPGPSLALWIDAKMVNFRPLCCSTTNLSQLPTEHKITCLHCCVENILWLAAMSLIPSSRLQANSNCSAPQWVHTIRVMGFSYGTSTSSQRCNSIRT